MHCIQIQSIKYKYLWQNRYQNQIPDNYAVNPTPKYQIQISLAKTDLKIKYQIIMQWIQLQISDKTVLKSHRSFCKPAQIKMITEYKNILMCFLFFTQSNFTWYKMIRNAQKHDWLHSFILIFIANIRDALSRHYNTVGWKRGSSGHWHKTVIKSTIIQFKVTLSVTIRILFVFI